MLGVMIIPTGLGCEIGGHAGDANPACKLIAHCCDKLIVHPNVVNASDVNEMPRNCLYVEGSVLNRFLRGDTFLKEVSINSILTVANPPLGKETINAVSSGRVTIGFEAEVMELKTPLRMIARIENDRATGDVIGWEALVDQVKDHPFDALAIHTLIECDRDVALNYFRKGGVNPWGGVEAKASKLIADALNKPVAHAPLDNTSHDDEELYFIFDKEVVDPRMAPEAISTCYLHCVLKGLIQAPRPSKCGDLKFCDVDFLLSPPGCWGPPHEACQKHGIPILTVAQNKHECMIETPETFEVENYLEAAG